MIALVYAAYVDTDLPLDGGMNANLPVDELWGVLFHAGQRD